MQSLWKKNTKQVRWSKQGIDFNNKFTIKVEIVLAELYLLKILMCNFHVDDLQGRHRYDMIIGCDILSELNIDLCFSYNTIRLNGGTHKGCTAPMKDVSKINVNVSSDCIKDESFQKKELWEIKNVL